jgi:hypothetical protein
MKIRVNHDDLAGSFCGGSRGGRFEGDRRAVDSCRAFIRE